MKPAKHLWPNRREGIGRDVQRRMLVRIAHSVIVAAWRSSTGALNALVEASAWSQGYGDCARLSAVVWGSGVWIVVVQGRW
jgi:hypothetical protein